MNYVKALQFMAAELYDFEVNVTLHDLITKIMFSLPQFTYKRSFFVLNRFLYNSMDTTSYEIWHGTCSSHRQLERLFIRKWKFGAFYDRENFIKVSLAWL
jgi:hypothetical protein